MSKLLVLKYDIISSISDISEANNYLRTSEKIFLAQLKDLLNDGWNAVSINSYKESTHVNGKYFTVLINGDYVYNIPALELLNNLNIPFIISTFRNLNTLNKSDMNTPVINGIPLMDYDKMARLVGTDRSSTIAGISPELDFESLDQLNDLLGLGTENIIIPGISDKSNEILVTTILRSYYNNVFMTDPNSTVNNVNNQLTKKDKFIQYLDCTNYQTSKELLNLVNYLYNNTKLSTKILNYLGSIKNVSRT